MHALSAQVSERMRLGHEASLLTEAREAAEAGRTHAQAGAHHLQERIATLTAQLGVRHVLGIGEAQNAVPCQSMCPVPWCTASWLCAGPLCQDLRCSPLLRAASVCCCPPPAMQRDKLRPYTDELCMHVRRAPWRRPRS